MAELLTQWFWKDNLKHMQWKAKGVQVHEKDKALLIKRFLKARLIGPFSALSVCFSLNPEWKSLELVLQDQLLKPYLLLKHP